MQKKSAVWEGSDGVGAGREVAPTAIKAYHGKAGIYEQVVQRKGAPLRMGFTLVKVRASRSERLARCWDITRDLARDCDLPTAE